MVDRDHRPLFMLEQAARAFGHPPIVRIGQPALAAALRSAAVGTGCTGRGRREHRIRARSVRRYVAMSLQR